MKSRILLRFAPTAPAHHQRGICFFLWLRQFFHSRLVRKSHQTIGLPSCHRPPPPLITQRPRSTRADRKWPGSLFSHLLYPAKKEANNFSAPGFAGSVQELSIHQQKEKGYAEGGL